MKTLAFMILFGLSFWQTRVSPCHRLEDCPPLGRASEYLQQSVREYLIEEAKFQLREICRFQALSYMQGNGSEVFDFYSPVRSSIPVAH